MRNNKWVNTSILVLIVAGILVIAYQPWKISLITNSKKVISNQSYTNIDIETANTKVIIVPTKSNEATVHLSGKGLNRAKSSFDAFVNGDTLSVQLNKKRKVFFGLFDMFSNYTLTVSIPEKHYESIKVEGKNGRINVDNLQVDEIRLDTKNGRIALNNIHADTIDLATKNGKIELSHITSKMVNAKTSNGKMILDQVTGSINGKTSNGRITLVTDSLDQRIELTTSNGKIEILSAKEPTNAVIEAKTSNGKIDIFGNSNSRTTFGHGENLIKLRTSNGKVSVKTAS